MGDGAFTSFWHDKRKGDVPLAISFHRIFAWDNYRLEFVRDHVSLGWARQPSTISRLPRGGIEQTQYDVFMTLLQNV